VGGLSRIALKKVQNGGVQEFRMEEFRSSEVQNNSELLYSSGSKSSVALLRNPSDFFALSVCFLMLTRSEASNISASFS
jgi:hypothetical protein